MSVIWISDCLLYLSISRLLFIWFKMDFYTEFLHPVAVCFSSGIRIKAVNYLLSFQLKKKKETILRYREVRTQTDLFIWSLLRSGLAAEESRMWCLSTTIMQAVCAHIHVLYTHTHTHTLWISDHVGTSKQWWKLWITVCVCVVFAIFSSGIH